MTKALMQAQQRIEQEQKMKTWQEAAKQVAHEIKNPLTPIQLATERLQRKFGKQLENDPLFLDCTTTIIDQVNTIKTLIHYFVQFASLPPVTITACNLAQVIDDVLKLYRASYPAITFTVDEPVALPLVYTDSAKIKLVLINLLDNSVRAGALTITISLNRDHATNEIIMTCADNGPGIPETLRETLFLPYVSTNKKNLGLGLAIVHQIFKQLGGSICLLQSQRGAVFLCRLPQKTTANNVHQKTIEE
jgi:two-component system nitrogen regulation sensor histidine kinase NtrY